MSYCSLFRLVEISGSTPGVQSIGFRLTLSSANDFCCSTMFPLFPLLLFHCSDAGHDIKARSLFRLSGPGVQSIGLPPTLSPTRDIFLPTVPQAGSTTPPSHSSTRSLLCWRLPGRQHFVASATIHHHEFYFQLFIATFVCG